MFLILRQVYIYKDNNLLYFRNFGKAVTKELFQSLLDQISKDAFKGPTDKTNYFDYYKSRVVYTTSKELGLIVIYLSSLSLSCENLETRY